MKLGDVLKKEREKRGGSAQEVWTDMRPLSAETYRQIEAWRRDAEFERVGALIAKFCRTFDMPVGQLFYACGLPFQEVQDYDWASR